MSYRDERRRLERAETIRRKHVRTLKRGPLGGFTQMRWAR